MEAILIKQGCVDAIKGMYIKSTHKNLIVKVIL